MNDFDEPTLMNKCLEYLERGGWSAQLCVALGVVVTIASLAVLVWAARRSQASLKQAAFVIALSFAPMVVGEVAAANSRTQVAEALAKPPEETFNEGAAYRIEGFVHRSVGLYSTMPAFVLACLLLGLALSRHPRLQSRADTRQRDSL